MSSKSAECAGMVLVIGNDSDVVTFCKLELGGDDIDATVSYFHVDKLFKTMKVHKFEFFLKKHLIKTKVVF